LLLLESIQTHLDKHEQLNKITYAAHLELEAGATTVYMKEPLSVIRTIMENPDQLPVRTRPMVWISDINKDDELDKIFRDPVLKNQACICLICDGTFDGHTAATFEPYYDDPSTLGMLYHEEETLYRFMKKAHLGGHQLSVHTVSDRAIEQVLDTYERILREHPRLDHRHRFEHFELFTKAQLKRVARLGLSVGIQPIFVPFCEGPDLEGYRRFIGEERVRRANHFRSIIDEGILAAGGSDSPAAPLNHMQGIQACLTHPNKEARISLHEALRLYTLDAARIGFEENIKGSIKAGKLADFIVLDEDPFRVSPDTIGEIQVEMTILGGKIVNKL
ncbi:amidohydrolase family protein, partial [bacterium]|nr:amidohydrolase family protein [bacterium]